MREYNAAHGVHKLWIATVMPGYDDAKAPGRTHTYRYDRRNGEYYRQTWQAAIASSPDLVIITSFNEWVEGTMIEPSVSYGNLYLDITAQEAAHYKSTDSPAEKGTPTPTPLLPEDTPTAAPSPTVTPAPTVTSTATATPTPLPTATLSPTVTPTATPTHTPSPTSIPPTVTSFQAMVNSSPASVAGSCPAVVVPVAAGLVALALTGRAFVIRSPKHRE